MREVTNPFPSARPRAALLLSAIVLSACSYLPELPSMPSLASIKPYRIDIQQGNFLSPEMVTQLQALLDAHNAEQAEPLWPSVVESVQRIDKTGAEPYVDGDEYTYWPN